jgi:hypothetical protein
VGRTMKKFRIICPSKGRAENVMTSKLINNMLILVPHGEGELYREHNPDHEIMETPEGLKGITRTKQFMMDNFDEWFSIDDDIEKIRKNYEDDEENAWITDPDYAYDIIMRCRDMAQQMGAKMYGFYYKRQPVHYQSHNPFWFTGYMNSSHFGILKGHNLYYNLDMDEGEDHWLSLLNAYSNRYFLMDTRYSFITKDNFSAQGGCNDYRTSASMKKNTMILRKTFGQAVTLKTPNTGKTKLREYERTVSVPF